MPPIIDPNKCTGCGKCVEACSEDVFFGSEQGRVPVVTYPEACVHFNCCVYECPKEGAIRLRIPLPLMLLYKSCSSGHQLLRSTTSFKSYEGVEDGLE